MISWFDIEDLDGNEMRWYQVLTSDTQVTDPARELSAIACARVVATASQMPASLHRRKLMRSMRLRSRYIRLFQRTLTLRLDLGEMQQRMPALGRCKA
jgi:hypothetical protein